jgi:hypothetical protein
MSGGITIIGGPATPISAGVGANASDGYATTYYPGTSNIAEAQTVAVNVGQEANVSFALVSARMSRISGVIRNSLGNPVAMAPITLRRREGAGSIGGMTQVDGSFTLTRVPPGETLYRSATDPGRTNRTICVCGKRRVRQRPRGYRWSGHYGSHHHNRTWRLYLWPSCIRRKFAATAEARATH